MKPVSLRSEGFTLIELALIMVLISVLVVTAIPKGGRIADEARSAALKRNLLVIRDSIARYHKDNGKYPTGLQSLVSEGYLTSVPRDPFEADGGGWTEKPSNEEAADLFDVSSSSKAQDSRGKNLSDY